MATTPTMAIVAQMFMTMLPSGAALRESTDHAAPLDGGKCGPTVLGLKGGVSQGLRAVKEPTCRAEPSSSCTSATWAQTGQLRRRAAVECRQRRAPTLPTEVRRRCCAPQGPCDAHSPSRPCGGRRSVVDRRQLALGGQCVEIGIVIPDDRQSFDGELFENCGDEGLAA